MWFDELYDFIDRRYYSTTSTTTSGRPVPMIYQPLYSSYSCNRCRILRLDEIPGLSRFLVSNRLKRRLTLRNTSDHQRIHRFPALANRMQSVLPIEQVPLTIKNNSCSVLFPFIVLDSCLELLDLPTIHLPLPLRHRVQPLQRLLRRDPDHLRKHFLVSFSRSHSHCSFPISIVCIPASRIFTYACDFASYSPMHSSLSRS